MNWFINLFSSKKNLRIGSRVKTTIGWGTVTQGSVSIKYDEGVKMKGHLRDIHPNNRTVTHNLNAIQVIED